MSKSKRRDIAQRIVSALTQRVPPEENTHSAVNPEVEVIVGQVPIHLRHLANLVEALALEYIFAVRAYNNLCAYGEHSGGLHDSVAQVEETKREYHIVQALLDATLPQYIQDNTHHFLTLRISDNWEIVADKFTRCDSPNRDTFVIEEASDSYN